MARILQLTVHGCLLLLLFICLQCLPYCDESVQKHSVYKNEGRPVILLKSDEHDVYKVQDDVLVKMFKSLPQEILDRKLAVISIVGEYRKGKSFLLNLMLRYLQNNGKEGWLDNNVNTLKGFSWRAGIDRVTNGIVAWSQPLLFGDDLAVILLDTEGMHDEHSSEVSMSLIYTITAQISSVQIYNTLNFNKNDISSIKFFLDFAKISQHGSFTKTQFQKLQFLVRDWIPEQDYNFGEEGGNKLLQRWKKSDKDGVFDSLKDIYAEKLSCYLMPYPGDDVAKNSKYNKNIQNMDKDFKKHVEIFIRNLFLHSVKARNYENKQLYLEDFPLYFKMFSNTLLESKFVPKTAYQLQIEESCRVARDKVGRAYIKDMTDNLVYIKSQQDLKHFNNRAHMLAMTIFDACPMFGGKDNAANCNSVLQEELLQNYEDFKKFVEKILHQENLDNSHLDNVISNVYNGIKLLLNPKQIIKSIFKLLFGHRQLLLN